MEATNVEMNVENIHEESKDKKYKFRELNSTDVFHMFTLLNKIGVKEFKGCVDSPEVKKAIAQAVESGMSGDELANAVGIDVVFEIAGVIFDNVPKCEADIYKMLSRVSDLSVESIMQLKMAEFFEMIVDFIKLDDFKDFIEVVSRLFK